MCVPNSRRTDIEMPAVTKLQLTIWLRLLH
jgi:hypothetical protein